MPSASRKPSAKSVKSTSAAKQWSQHVTETSHALALDHGVFSLSDPLAIARSLKRSADRSHNRKSDPYRSAMSMLTFYINRAGKSLPAQQRDILEKAKVKLRELFDRPPASSSPSRQRPLNRR